MDATLPDHQSADFAAVGPERRQDPVPLQLTRPCFIEVNNSINPRHGGFWPLRELMTATSGNANDERPSNTTTIFNQLDYNKWIRQVRAKCQYSEFTHRLEYRHPGRNVVLITDAISWRAALEEALSNEDGNGDSDRCVFYIEREGRFSLRPNSAVCLAACSFFP